MDLSVKQLIIINNVYKRLLFPAPKIKPTTLKKLLPIYTTQVRFYDLVRNIFTQIDGVNMGSPLVLMLSEFLGNQIFKKKKYISFYQIIFVICLVEFIGCVYIVDT